MKIEKEVLTQRPELDEIVNDEVFLQFYYLKKELVAYCKDHGLKTCGGKLELTKRIEDYIKNGKSNDSNLHNQGTSCSRKEALQRTQKGIADSDKNRVLTHDTIIETPFVCSEVHRAFFKEQIGKSFSFLVPFQKWLKENPGKTYQDAIDAYHEIVANKKKEKTPIGPQFEYNTYIRDFFADNPGHSLQEAILCWKYKKALPGSNRYEAQDLQEKRS